MTQIITLGEVLIDLTQTGTDEKGTPQFAAFPGGAPANVAVAASRLGAKAGFIGKIGSDAFGAQLRETLEKDDVDTAYLFESNETPTTLAIVSVDENGERGFSFYRDPGADTQLTEEEATAFLASQDVEDGLPEILHFGSLSLTTEPSRSAALAAVKGARDKGILISYDPNYREALWKDEDEAVSWMKKPLDMTDILKISDEELVLLTGTEDLKEGSKRLSEYGISLIMITLGSEGVFYRLTAGLRGDDPAGLCGDSPAYVCGTVPAEKVEVCDTNGAGDTFLGAVLAKIAARPGGDVTDCGNCDGTGQNAGGQTTGTGSQTTGGKLHLTRDELEQALAFANRAAALTCSRAGAIPAMPTAKELGE